MTMWETQAESLPREELEAQTLEGLRKTLGHVLANPAWRRRLTGAEPGDIRTAADWSRLLFLTKDDGKGFDKEKAQTNSSGLGLRSLESRCEILNGILSLESSPGAGTNYFIKIPVK